MSDTALNKIIQYGTAAERAAFTPNPAVGSQVLYIWYDTDSAPDTYVWDGAAWVQINSGGGSGTLTKYTLGVTIDGGGSAVSTGVKGYRSVPITGTISKVRLLADQAGNAVMDIWKDTYANYPPTVADTITAAAKPTLTAADKYEDTTLTGWTTAVTAGDVLGFNVDSAATITRLTLELEITVP